MATHPRAKHFRRRDEGFSGSGFWPDLRGAGQLARGEIHIDAIEDAFGTVKHAESTD